MSKLIDWEGKKVCVLGLGIILAVIVGISYQPCDRREINSIIDYIPVNAKIQLINPNPTTEFEEKLRRVSDKVQGINPTDFLMTSHNTA